jgi:glycosyltransferase involved in cell wall biosynthesis
MRRNPRKPLVSVVVITLNEEKRLPRLLACLAAQSFQDFEVIVADAHSIDATRAIAKRWGAKVVTGGLPSVGRNRGAKAAQGQWLLFLDADTCFNERFIERLLAKANKKKICIATVWSKPDSERFLSKIIYGFFNIWAVGLQFIWPHAPGYCILVRTAIHHTVRGFDEHIEVLEDADYVRRAAEYARFRILPLSITISDRRFERGKRWRTIKALLEADWYSLRGRLPGKRYDYAWGEHAEQKRRSHH